MASWKEVVPWPTIIPSVGAKSLLRGPVNLFPWARIFFLVGIQSGHFGHLVICQNRKRMLSKPPLYYKYKYLYIVSNDRVSEIENDQNDLDHFDHVFVFFLIYVHESSYPRYF